MKRATSPDHAARYVIDAPAAHVGTRSSAIQWRRSLAWLLFLGPFFFLSYGFANYWAQQHEVSRVMVFAWEVHIPFWAWSIIPYWSIDLLYGLSFLLCRSPKAVDRHALRLLSVQIISVTCFLLFPLRFSFERPVTDGVFGALFDVLMSFDRPYNQAPSLHIGLLMVIWYQFALHTRGIWRWVVHAWALLIGLSVLTTYQHHFIDVPTGALVGLLCIWLWPEQGRSPLSGWRWQRTAMHWRLALIYALSGLLVAVFGVLLGGVWLWGLWIAVSLWMLALIYIGPGVHGFQKRQGAHSMALTVLMWPCLLGLWLNSRGWTRRHPQPDHISGQVWLGRIPTRKDIRRYEVNALYDLTAEMRAPRGAGQTYVYKGQPCMDLIAPQPHELLRAAQDIDHLHSQGYRVLVCCALGYSRSASCVAAWLLWSGQAAGVEEALAKVQQHRARTMISPRHWQALEASWHMMQKEAAAP